MDYKIVTPVAAEPITLQYAKDFIHANPDAGDDTFITGLISTAREYCEDKTWRALALQTIEAYPCKFTERLPRPPLRSVVSVAYKDSDGTSHALAPDVDYLVDIERERLVLPPGKSWPSFVPWPVHPITITYTAGYETLPFTIKQAMLLLISHWYDNRDAIMTTPYGASEVSDRVGLAVDALLGLRKAMRFV